VREKQRNRYASGTAPIARLIDKTPLLCDQLSGYIVVSDFTLLDSESTEFNADRLS
jgi:hypothetical protein